MYSSLRENRGLQDLQKRDISYIIRFDVDNTYHVVDYMSPSIIGLNTLERLTLNRNDRVEIHLKDYGVHEGVVWFRGKCVF